jgi:deoxyribose-phosphate aldolase
MTKIIQIATLIKIVISNFEESQYCSVFVKSSTGFYKTEGGFTKWRYDSNNYNDVKNASPTNQGSGWGSYLCRGKK